MCRWGCRDVRLLRAFHAWAGAAAVARVGSGAAPLDVQRAVCEAASLRIAELDAQG